MSVMEACKCSFAQGDVVNVGVRDEYAFGSMIYSTGVNWSFGYDYVAPAWRCEVLVRLKAITVNGLTVVATVEHSDGNYPTVGDVLTLGNGLGYILLVQSYDPLTGELAARICNAYAIDSNGTITLLVGGGDPGPYYVLRPGMFPRTGGTLTPLTIVTTAGTNVVRLKDPAGDVITDATPYYQPGDTIMVAPSFPLALERNPLRGFIVVTSVAGGDITTNKQALRANEIPATPGLCRGFF